MAEERGYDRQLGPAPAQRAVLANAEVFGAGLGRAVESAGSELYRIEAARRQDEEWAKFQHDFGSARENLDGISRESRSGGADGHAMRVGQAWDAHREGLLGGITSREVRRRAEAQMDDYGIRLRTGEATWEEGARVEKTVAEYERSRAIRQNRIFRLEKPEDYAAEMQIAQAAIAAFNVPQSVKDKMWDEEMQGGTISFLRGRIEADSALAKAMIESGQFDFVQPQALQALRDKADVGIRAAQHAAVTEQVAARTGVKAEIGATVKAVADRKIYDDEQLAALEQRGVDAGLNDNDLYAIREARATNRVRQVYAKALPQAMQADLDQMNAQLAQQGDKAPRELVQARNALEAELEARRGDWRADPLGTAASMGMTVTAIDWAAPERSVVRARQAETAEIAKLNGGVFRPLRTDEIDSFKGQLGRGIAGERDILSSLDAFDPAYRRAAARQIDPEDTQFHELATLPTRYREFAWRGREALKANKAILKTDDPKVQISLDEMNRRWNKATVGMAADQRAARRQIADQIAAGYLDRDGTEIRGGTLFEAMQQALGASGPGDQRKGGIAKWGHDGYYLLPPTLTAPQFIKGVTAFARGKRENAPVNPDGSLADLNRATPVMVRPGVYEFRAANGRPIGRRGGGAFTFRIGGQGG